MQSQERQQDYQALSQMPPRQSLKLKDYQKQVQEQRNKQNEDPSSSNELHFITSRSSQSNPQRSSCNTNNSSQQNNFASKPYVFESKRKDSFKKQFIDQKTIYENELENETVLFLIQLWNCNLPLNLLYQYRVSNMDAYYELEKIWNEYLDLLEPQNKKEIEQNVKLYNQNFQKVNIQSFDKFLLNQQKKGQSSVRLKEYFLQIENRNLVNWDTGIVDNEKLKVVGKMYLTQNEISAIRNGKLSEYLQQFETQDIELYSKQNNFKIFSQIDQQISKNQSAPLDYNKTNFVNQHHQKFNSFADSFSNMKQYNQIQFKNENFVTQASSISKNKQPYSPNHSNFKNFKDLNQIFQQTRDSANDWILLDSNPNFQNAPKFVVDNQQRQFSPTNCQQTGYEVLNPFCNQNCNQENIQNKHSHEYKIFLEFHLFYLLMKLKIDFQRRQVSSVMFKVSQKLTSEVQKKQSQNFNQDYRNENTIDEIQNFEDQQQLYLESKQENVGCLFWPTHNTQKNQEQKINQQNAITKNERTLFKYQEMQNSSYKFQNDQDQVSNASDVRSFSLLNESENLRVKPKKQIKSIKVSIVNKPQKYILDY